LQIEVTMPILQDDGILPTDRNELSLNNTESGLKGAVINCLTRYG